MGTVNRAEMRAIEGAAIHAGWTEERLLDLAGTRLGHALGRFFPDPGTIVAYLGKGHNAGDALAAMRVLRDDYGWRLAARCAFDIEACAPITRSKWNELGLPAALDGPPPWHGLRQPLVLLDGLLGIGASGPLSGQVAALAAEMEYLREMAGATVAAVDLPSGMDPDTGMPAAGAVTADITFMIGNAKVGALSSAAVNSVGALALVPVEPLAKPAVGPIELIAPQEMDFGKSPRPFDFHKGLAGKVAIVAGSTSYPGAATLAATGALRAGAGLVTLHAPHDQTTILAAKCPPEIIIRGYRSFRELDIGDSMALAVGCGMGSLGPDETAAFLHWLDAVPLPTVIDADALNLIAESGRSDLLRTNHLLTPHPGEFRRLAPDLVTLPREQAARAFTDRHPATLLLKGGRSLITRHGHPIWVNSTGSPGMATGGQGDLLAGVLAALLARGLGTTQAAALGAWLCGRASEIAESTTGQSPESLTPSGTAQHLGTAFRQWRNAAR
jgi:NAD(P)H-hydrate epimerase